MGEGTGDSLRSVLTFSLSILVLSSHTHLQHLHTASRISQIPSGSLRKLPEGPRSRSPGACEGHTCRVHAWDQCGWGWAEHTCGLHGCWGQGPEQLTRTLARLERAGWPAPESSSRGPAHRAVEGAPEIHWRLTTFGPMSPPSVVRSWNTTMMCAKQGEDRSSPSGCTPESLQQQQKIRS